MFWRKTEKKIGQILVNADLITEEELDQALEIQKVNGERIGKILVNLGYVGEKELIKCIAEQYRLPCLSLERYDINKELLNVIPEELSKNHAIVPLDLIGDILTIGIADVPDEKVFKLLENLTGYKIQVMLVTTSDFNKFMERINKVPVYDEESKEDRYAKAPSYKGIERRRFPRFGKELKIKYQFRDEYHIDSTINISQGGLLIKSKCPIAANAHIIIKLELPALQRDLIIISKVVWVKHIEKENNYLIGFCFISMDSSDSARLSEFIKVLSS